MSTGRVGACIVLLLYVLTLAVIALWPEPVDADLGALLRRIHDLVPFLTYRRMEAGANVLLFVPYGALLAIALGRAAHLVLPIALLTTVAIEAAQTLLPGRTPTVRDILANVVGACLGLVLAEVALRVRASARRRAQRTGIRESAEAREARPMRRASR